jgi:hypothetical protein
MKRIALGLTVVLGFYLMAFNNPKATDTKTDAPSIKREPTSTNMNSFISLFEIPALDVSRAVDFYQTVLDIQIERITLPDMEMGIFPYENQAVTGVIIKSKGYQPSANGVTIYLNAGNNLQVILDRVEAHGGKIIQPKTAHADESGYFALFSDTEGNKLGLNSPN